MKVKIIENIGIILFGICISAYMLIFTMRLKSMWLFGEAMMLEPNEYISGFEFFLGAFLTMVLVYITIGQIENFARALAKERK